MNGATTSRRTPNAGPGGVSAPGGKPPGRAPRTIAGLDGLRALAVIGAMLFHAGVLQGGFLGVDLFFVLSGYLITGLLLQERARTGAIRLGQFWLRRLRRLAPALLAVLAVTLVWAYLFASPSVGLTTTKQTAWSLVYLNNWFALFGDVGYWGAGVTKTPLNHLWSLAIEEQFYLVWPLLVFVAMRLLRGRADVAIVALSAAVLSGAWQWWVADQQGAERAYLGSDTRAVALFLGCFLAAVAYQRFAAANDGAARDPERPAHRYLWHGAVLVSAAWLGFSWLRADIGNVGLYHGWLVSCSAAAALLLAGVVASPGAWYTSLLSARPMVWIGKRSYSLYLWHWAIWIMVTESSVGLTGAGLWILRIGLTLLATVLCYDCIEQPVRTSRVGWPRLAGLLGAPAAIMAVVVIALPPVLPPTMTSEPVSLKGSGGDGSLKILLAGDSWARNMGFGLSLADEQKRHTYINLGAGGCGLATAQTPECGLVAERWAGAVANQQPDVSLLMVGTMDQDAGVKLDGRQYSPCTTEFGNFYARELDKAVGTLTGPNRIPVYVVGVRDNVHGDNERSKCINRLLSEAAERNSVKFLDLNALLCPEHKCVTQHENEPVYDETKHLGPAGQRWAGGWILQALQQDLAPRAGAAAPQAPARPNPCAAESPEVRPLAVKSYLSTPAPGYPDSGKELTNGARGKGGLEDEAWQGWQGTADVVLDLGKPQTVCSVKSSWLQALTAGVFPPPELEVRVSDSPADQGTLLGSTGAPQISAADQSSIIRVVGQAPLTGRYVTLRALRPAGWSFVDEVAVLPPPAEGP